MRGMLGVVCASCAAGALASTAAAAGPTTPQLSLFAGDGSVEYSQPGPTSPIPALSADISGYGVAVDPNDGDVYLVDAAHSEIDRVTPAGLISVVAGSDATNAQPADGAVATDVRLGDPTQVAVDPVSGDIYFADDGDDEVDMVDPAGGLTIIADRTSVPLPQPSDNFDPFGIAVDSETGDVFIGDEDNNVVDMITPSGTASIVAGTGVPGTPQTGPATQSPLGTLWGIAVDDVTGDLYIADTGNSEIERVTPAGELSVVAGDGTYGAPTPGPATASSLYEPLGVTVDPTTGDLYIDTDFGVPNTGGRSAGQVEEVDAAGDISELAGGSTLGTPTAGPAADSPLGTPVQPSVDPTTGDLYVADNQNHVVERITPAIPVNLQPPTVSGDAQTGDVLTALPGRWTGARGAFADQWEECSMQGGECSPIAGATQPTYTLTPQDAGRTVVVSVTATNGGGSASRTSAATPTITATATATTTPTTPAAPTAPTPDRPDPLRIWDVHTTRHSVDWCLRARCAYPHAQLRFMLNRAAVVRLVLRVRHSDHWRTAAVATLHGRPGANRNRIAGRWHGRLLAGGHDELLVQIRPHRRFRTAATVRLTVRRHAPPQPRRRS